MTEWTRQLVNQKYLPAVPPIIQNGARITGFPRPQTDFAIVDVLPDDLLPLQRLPHVDPVPVFGLVYLNREERGGTLFFRQTAAVQADATAKGYPAGDMDSFALAGGIAPAFNRMAIYPGFVPHSGEIAGNWITGEERRTSPRLTQRLVFQA
jgi:hypothetical protein